MRTPCPDLTNEQSRRSSDSANRLLIETLSALASALSVDSDGEIVPFSIFDSMPALIPAFMPSWATVRSMARRKRRTCAPISSSMLSVLLSAGASEPVSNSSSPGLRWGCRTAEAAGCGDVLAVEDFAAAGLAPGRCGMGTSRFSFGISHHRGFEAASKEDHTRTLVSSQESYFPHS